MTVAERESAKRPSTDRGRDNAPGSRRRKGSPHASPWWALLFIGPTGVGLLVFYIWPTIRTFWLSFTKSGPFGGSKFIGIDNYQTLLSDPDVWGALRNTGIYALIVLVGIPISIVIAALLNTAGLRGRGAFRTLYFVPVVTMPAAIALVWRMIYNGDYGIFNQLLAVFGLEGRSWLTDPKTALVAIAVVGIWSGLGTSIVIFLAGLQGIPDTIMEAAEIDGAGPVRKFFSVTLPLLSPSIFFITVINLINALQVFDLIYMMLGRNNPALPNTRTVVYLFYEIGFKQNDRGEAAALASILLSIILVLTILQFRLQKRWVHYG